ncbi:adenosylmethionine--8-amino-7-oxononanoate transaminase [Shewanella sp. C32]|uniref:Adenosylmethionine-8-amino-7-oxononanoate aminotransferase n=1 Tax=Shewanella electrica TaxID=515560 RepID=A0ABT2FNH9_9GAMM|nr:adenosylmethionine--8-amino-7-oxononanoate transaminase [Shewanella electrica]MCH1924794.1 adenosylmethionine--8-amino-7-oxononanoate transaminase [Shewanella electrica]MCS4556759.1 adenosylmethionine--8-amino-7-oxononanoate transaminase [Shewanella electrica]
MSNLDYSFDQQHIWHPYSSMRFPTPTFGVTAANGVRLTLDSGEQLVDGTSSWWACIHGYGHADIVAAMQQQLQQLSHVMFGGITHQPAIDLCKQLLALAPNNLTKVFLADSGSIAVEVAMKMALQYWQGRSANTKSKILTVRRGYHGDTFAAMSVCDPTEGMHSMFGANVAQQLFAPAPKTPFGEQLIADDTAELEQMLAEQHQQIAALIIEPIMQGAGAMWFYSAAYLKRVRELCDKYQVLLILDEIATGFGRTGKLFACEHADIQPDIMCVGKALTGGYISLAATLCSDEVASGISDSPAGVFMHGPTFMANPLACAAANASLTLISQGTWQQQVAAIETQMQRELAPAAAFEQVVAVRVLGAVGVIELNHTVDTGKLQQEFVKRGVWVRPFSRFIYIMPPYVINSEDLSQLTAAMVEVAKLTRAPTTSQFISHG